MATNYFECYRCGKMTRHIELSLREYEALTGDDSFVEQSVASIFDMTGMSKVASNVFGRKFWKCCECGRPSRRNLKGDEV